MTRVTYKFFLSGNVPAGVRRKAGHSANLLILVVDDEPDVEVLFRQQFRHDLRVGRFAMKFAPSGDVALQHIADAAGVSIILILSDINMPGMTGLELLPKAKAARPDVPGRGGAFCQADRFWSASQRNSIRGLNAPRDYVPVRGKADMPRISRNVR